MRSKQFVMTSLAVLMAATVWAAENNTPTKEEITKEMANPNTALTSLKLQTQYYSFDGNLPLADDQDMVKLFLQPTLPFPLKSGKDLHY